MFFKILKILLVAVFAAMMSGCVVVGAGIGAAISEGEANALTGIVEVGEVKMKPGVNVALIKTAKLSSAVFEKDMTTLNASPSPSGAKVSAVVTEEIRHSLGAPGNTVSPVTLRLKTTFFEGGMTSGFYYYHYNTERNTLSYMQKNGARKFVNTHFTLEQGSDTLLEVHGLWVAGNQGDEIAGASKLAKEIVSEVMKKLSVTSAPSRESVTEAETKKE